MAIDHESWIDEKCGRHFVFRDFIECSDTWQRTHVPNLPNEPATLEAIRTLCESILDPLVERWGPSKLTYGFASRQLAKAVGRGIAPRLDQHAGHERRDDGRPICPRLGMAADVHVPGANAFEVALWTARRTPFDRLYLYGDHRPLHVSVGPECTRQIVWLRAAIGGRRVPVRLSLEKLAAQVGTSDR